MKLSRTRLGLMTQLFTGHNFMMRHQNIIDSYVDPTCRLCEEDEESVAHIVGNCTALSVKRLLLWEDPGEFSPPFIDWDLYKLISFIKHRRIGDLFDPNLE